MTDPPEPLSIPIRESIQPAGHWLSRACQAVFVERRLPTRLQDVIDSAAMKCGFLRRTIHVSDEDGGASRARLHVRRGTADIFFVQEVFGNRAYSPPGFEIGETDIVIDVGGNIGSFAVFAGRRARSGRVISLEPAGDSFDLLSRNVSTNRLPHVTPLRAAVAAKSGPVTLYRSEIGTGHHSLDPLQAGPGSKEEVDGVTLAELLDRFGIARCDFLKLDCEGAEFEIWNSISSTSAARIRRVAMEYHTRPGKEKRAEADALVCRLIDLGFTIDRYEDHLQSNRGMIFAHRR